VNPQHLHLGAEPSLNRAITDFGQVISIARKPAGGLLLLELLAKVQTDTDSEASDLLHAAAQRFSKSG
jgi:hypothetical protein